MAEEAVSPAQELLTCNGVDATTGAYLQGPMTVNDACRVAQGLPFDADHLAELKARQERETQDAYGVGENIDGTDLAQAGWGVVFPANHDPAIREALAPLLDLRRKQASAKNERFYREYIGPDAYRPDESKTKFLQRNGAGPGVVDPKNAPYYMLLVGDPQAIPYRFQYQLDVQYAVGRICFDTVEEYAQYARSVVEAETCGLALARRAAFFGVANPGDSATSMSSADLVAPLAQLVADDNKDAWKVDTIAPADALKTRLATLLGGADTPALLFTASHGMGYPNGHPRQFAQQGALLCQNWPGSSWNQPVPPEFYFTGDDLCSDARLLGLIAVHFACYGAGTPQFEDYAPMGATGRAAIAPRGFVARLPQKLLAHPRGGALAVIGHVERAWGYSFTWTGAGRQLQTFQGTLDRLMKGEPVGYAMEYFNSRYAELSSDLSSELEEIKYGKVANDYEVAGMWTSNNDARSYSVIGDPAVRLALADKGTAEVRPVTSSPIVVTTQAISPVPESPPKPPVPAEGEAPFGLLDSLKNAQTTISSSLQDAVPRIVASLLQAVQNVTATEVVTYVSDNMANVQYENGRFTGAKMCAMTRISLTGDTLACVPTSAAGQVDDALWKIHCDAVDKALAGRSDAIKLATSAATSLLGVLKLL